MLALGCIATRMSRLRELIHLQLLVRAQKRTRELLQLAVRALVPAGDGSVLALTARGLALIETVGSPRFLSPPRPLLSEPLPTAAFSSRARPVWCATEATRSCPLSPHSRVRVRSSASPLPPTVSGCAPRTICCGKGLAANGASGKQVRSFRARGSRPFFQSPAVRYGWAPTAASSGCHPAAGLSTPVPELSTTSVLSLTRDTEGDLWVGTEIAGPHILRPQRFRTLPGLDEKAIMSVVQATDGAVWLGTREDGLLRVRDGEIGCPEIGSRLSSQVILALVAGLHADLDRVAASGPAGAGRRRIALDGYAPRHCAGRAGRGLTPARAGRTGPLAVARYGYADGLPSEEIVALGHPAATRTRSGELWLATPRCAALADPGEAVESSSQILVVLDRMEVDDVERSLSAAPLTTAPGHRDITFTYAGLSYRTPSRVSYRYRLESFDRQWIEAGDHPAPATQVQIRVAFGLVGRSVRARLVQQIARKDASAVVPICRRSSVRPLSECTPAAASTAPRYLGAFRMYPSLCTNDAAPRPRHAPIRAVPRPLTELVASNSPARSSA